MSDEMNLTCPACGAPVPQMFQKDTFTCDFCGSRFILHMEGQKSRLEWAGIDIPNSDEPTISTEQPNELVQTSNVVPSMPAPTSFPHQELSNKPVTPVLSSKKDGIKTNTKVILGILGALLLCCFVSAIVNLGKNGSQNTAVSNRSGATAEATLTNTPTLTPTPYFVTLPHSVKSSEGWSYKITKVQIASSIGDEKPDEAYFLLAFMDIHNQTGEYDCLKMSEFTASDGSNEVDMQYSGLDAAHATFKIDYPGAFLGQCLDNGKTDRSVLVFDLPKSPQEWSVTLQGQTVKIGKIDTILNPPPTATPLPSATPTITFTPTITPTALPSGIVSAAAGNFVNVRSGPGIDFAVAFQIEGQTAFSILHRNEQGDWYFIETENGDRGWIRNDLIQATVVPTLLSVSTEVIPTLTPVPTKTPTPRPTVPYSQQPPQGTWCGQNDSRGFCVSNFEYKSYIGYTSASAEGRFIAFGIGVKNISSFDISVNPFDFTMVMEDGRTYEHTSETYYYNNALQAVTVAPGNTATGAIVFYVPNDVGPRKIICRAGFLESNIEIDLYDKPEK